MSNDASQLVPLLEATDPIELASIRSLLDAERVSYVVQGEHHHQMSGGLFGNPAIAPRVLVDRADYERARKLLAARPVVEFEGTCAVHEKRATAKCRRCEAYLCEDCDVTGPPPMCESCAAGDQERHEAGAAKGRTLRKAVAWVMLAPGILAVLALVVAVVLRLLGVLPLQH